MHNTSLIDWFGQPIQIEQPEPANPNPCVNLYGPDLQGRRCKECALLTGITKNRTFYKCRLRQNNHSKTTDHQVRWQACAKFEPRTPALPLYDGR